MAFLLHSVDDGHVIPWEYLPCSAITPKVGMALGQTSGNLSIASGAPTYISMVEKEAACAAGDMIPVIRVAKDQVYEVPLSASGAALKLGDKVTLAADGLKVTATTTAGVAEIVGMNGTAVGDTVLVRF